MFLVSTGVIVGTSIGGLDLARHADVTTRLQYALDTAALAMGRLAASESDPDQLLTEARRYFEINFPPNFEGTRITADQIKLSGNSSGRVLTLSVDGLLPLLSTGFLDASAIKLAAKSTITLEGNPNLEVVFAVDTSTTPTQPATFPTKLATLGSELARLGNGSTHVGVVPYSEVVNVGKEHWHWVERWYSHADSSRITPFVQNYVKTRWTGCIAEPEPWKARDAQLLSPDANFMPIIARVETGLWTAKAGGNGPEKLTDDMNGTGWELNGTASKHELVIKTGVKQPESVTMLSSNDPPERLLWVDFYQGPGNVQNSNSPHERFHLYSLHEPANCNEKAQVAFLANDPNQIFDNLNNKTRINQPDSQRKALPPAGLLWSWRMMAPQWRGDSGWNGPAMSQEERTPARAIVVVTDGLINTWNNLSANDSANSPLRVWENRQENDFTFRLDYHTRCTSNGQGCSKNAEFLRTHVHDRQGSQLKLSVNNNGWQRPVSSLAMKDPFISGPNINFTNWPSVNSMTEKICNAISRDGINIFVLSPSQQLTNREVFAKCAGDNRLYSSNDLESLKEALLNLRSDSTKLRLVPSV